MLGSTWLPEFLGARHHHSASDWNLDPLAQLAQLALRSSTSCTTHNQAWKYRQISVRISRRMITQGKWTFLELEPDLNVIYHL